MTNRELRGRCQEKIKTLRIPRPFSIDQLHAELEDERDRALQSAPISTRPGTSCGLWIALAEADDVLDEQHTTPLHQLHIIGHETGHLLLGHHGTYVTGDELMRLLLPDLDLAPVRSVPGCTIYTDAEEHEAETFASLLLERIAPQQAEPIIRTNSGACPARMRQEASRSAEQGAADLPEFWEGHPALPP